MQQDVRRSDSTEGKARTEPEPEEKTGFARSLFRFGGKKKPAAEPARLTDRLKEVLERDRALIASQPELVEDGAHEVHDDEAWPDPFGAADPEAHTGTRPTTAWEDVDEPFAEQTGERSLMADTRISEIASWIEEEISEHAEGAGPVAIEAPLNADEAAELDAVLDDDSHELPAEPTLISETPVAAKPRAPSSRAQVKAKVSARPAPREADVRGASAREREEAVKEPVSKEPINTLTMARLLAMQGYKPRALAVYRELLKRTPDDEALRAEFEALKVAEP